MKGWHVFPTAFSSCPSALSQDSSPAKTNETQALMSHCKNSLRDKAIRGGFVRIQREATLQGVNHCWGQGLQPWYKAWLGFVRGWNSYANEWKDHPSHWGTTHSSLFWWSFISTISDLLSLLQSVTLLASSLDASPCMPTAVLYCCTFQPVMSDSLWPHGL